MQATPERRRLVNRISHVDLTAAMRRIYGTTEGSRLAARLRRLGPDWSRHREVVLEDTPFDSVVDAIVVGPGGVFTIVLAMWGADLDVSGELTYPAPVAAAVTTSPVSEACHAGWDAKTYLDWDQTQVHPVVAVAGSFEPTGVGWATVVGIENLVPWLESRPAILDWDEVLLASAILG
ncbi:MAG: hypothetical protein KJO84_01540, partial [Acidimicrobiia bacterium]|nr:hypothetical protein [Acidimicrobiia bacterium]